MSKKLIALCACPMGLAHTFMAAKAIEQAGAALGYEVKVETQGADGIKNLLTAEDIQQADIILHATAVTPVQGERFEEALVYEISLQEAIKEAKIIIEDIENGRF